MWEECGGRGGGVGMSEVCGRCGGVWERWRCVGMSEVCGRGGGVWEGYRSVLVGVSCVVAGVWEEWRCVEGMEAWGRGRGLWNSRITFLSLMLLICWCVCLCVCVCMCVCVSVCICVCVSVCICEANHFPDCAEDSEETNVNITGRTARSVVCGSWHCRVLEGVEAHGGRSGGVWW